MNLLSGAATPQESMPEWLQTAMQMSASTHFVKFTQSMLFARADLRGARLAGADLTQADLDLADVRGADLSLAKGLVQDQISKICGHFTTKLPSGLTPPHNWPCARAEAGD